MNKKISWLVPVCLLASACAYAPRDDAMPYGKLPPVGKAVECQTSPKTITVVATRAVFSVAPPHLCVEAGDSIKVVFTGNHPAGTITLSAKPFISAPWLSATNPGSTPQQDTIQVPDDAGGGITYPYNVAAIGWGTIDPMISVD